VPHRRNSVHFYALFLCVVAGALLARAEFALVVDSSSTWNALGALIGLALLSEWAALRERVGTLTTSVSFVPYLAAVIMLGPAWAMLVAGVTELLAEAVIRRKPLHKIVINTSKEVIAIGFAGYLYMGAGGVPSLESFRVNPPAFLAAVVTYFALTNGAVAAAVALDASQTGGEAWNRLVVKGFLENVLSSTVSILLAFLYIELQLAGLLIVVIPLFFVRHLHRTNLQLEQANRELLDLMVKSIEARDPYTSGHSVRVASYAKALARALGLSPKEIEYIETAALLHDVGKIYEEFAPVLRKKGKLSDEERLLMRSHPVRSAHHESYDGSGYPDGLVGDEIPTGARIIMIADTADAMMTDRPYRKALTYERVVEELEEYSDIQFDPEIVRAFKNSTAVRRLVEERSMGVLSRPSKPCRSEGGYQPHRVGSAIREPGV
jgi:putative nucleotidyltransferase with HDIG domain